MNRPTTARLAALEEPAAWFRRGAALPAGMPRTLIVLGPARGATSMVAQMLHDLGIFMGEGLDSTYQDAAMSEISRALFDGRIGIDHPVIEQVLRSRDRRFNVWGWKFPAQVVDDLYAKTRSPHFIVVFRDPVAVATRESVARGYNLEPCIERALEQISAFGRFMLTTPHPCLGISYERAMARKAELIDALVEFAGTTASGGVRQRAARGARPGSHEYLSDTRAAEIEGNIDCVNAAIAGWLRYPHQPNRRVAFTLRIDGAVVYRGVADRFREDLRRAFNNDGCCSFSIATPRNLIDGKPHRVRIEIETEHNYVIDRNDEDWVISGE